MVNGFDNTIHSPVEFLKPAIGLFFLAALWLFVLISLVVKGRWIWFAALTGITAIVAVIFGVWLHAHYRWV